jgi:hypothetical protein
MVVLSQLTEMQMKFGTVICRIGVPDLLLSTSLTREEFYPSRPLHPSSYVYKMRFTP